MRTARICAHRVVLIEAVGFGNPLCYMDLAFTLGLEYHRISDYQVYNEVPKFAKMLEADLNFAE